jgi:hypothetical protein
MRHGVYCAPLYARHSAVLGQRWSVGFLGAHAQRIGVEFCNKERKLHDQRNGVSRNGQFRAILFAHKRRAHRLICGQLLALCISRALAL